LVVPAACGALPYGLSSTTIATIASARAATANVGIAAGPRCLTGSGGFRPTVVPGAVAAHGVLAAAG
jgi:hypothetical protein